MISFYTPKAGGETALYIRVRTGNTDIKLSTGIKVDARKWRNRREKPATLEAVSRIEAVVAGRIMEGEDLSSAQIKQTLKDCCWQERNRQYMRKALGPVKMTLNRYISLYLSEAREGRRQNIKERLFKVSSLKSIAWAMRVFGDYQRDRKVEIDFDDVDLYFLTNFRLYMEAVRRFKVNTISKCIKELKTIMKVAKFEKYTDNDYFENSRYGVARRDVVSIALTKEELYRFAMVDVSSMGGKAQLAKDLFLSGVCTCQRFSDYDKLSSDNLEILDVDGQQVWMLHFHQQKTGNEVAIPCRPELKAILKKYNYRIPTMTQQVMNRHLKNIAKEAGIDVMVKVTDVKAGEERTYYVPKWKMVTSHVARRTGATLMYYMGVDMYDIMRITGHRSPEMLKKYIKAEPYDTVRKMYNTPFFRGE